MIQSNLPVCYNQAMYLSSSEIRTLHRAYAPSDAVFRLVYQHCEIVRDIALELIAAKGLSVDAELVRVGAMLHDIGVYSVLSATGEVRDGRQYIEHGIEGEEILRQEGLPEAVCRFATHHTGTGVTREKYHRRAAAAALAGLYGRDRRRATGDVC